MRKLAMAGDVGGIDPDQMRGLLGWMAGLATATIGAIGLWLAQRVLGKAAFQTAINDGFSKLTADLQEERDRLKAEAVAERAAWASERVAWTAERNDLIGEIRNLKQTLESMKHLLQRHGIETPDAPTTAALGPAVGAAIIPGDGKP